jgi:hypothetical protein
MTDNYGPSGVFCWIATQENTPATNTLTIIYYTFTWVVIILNSYFVLKVIWVLQQELGTEQQLIDKYTRKLRSYPIVQIVSYIPATINRIYNLSYCTENFELMMIQIIFDSITGLMYCFVFGFNNSVKKAVGEFCRSFFCKKNVDQSIETEEKLQSRLSNNSTFIDETIIE